MDDANIPEWSDDFDAAEARRAALVKKCGGEDGYRKKVFFPRAWALARKNSQSKDPKTRARGWAALKRIKEMMVKGGTWDGPPGPPVSL